MKLGKDLLSIGVIMQTPDIGGAETYMYSLLSEFRKRKSNILFASNNDRVISYIRPLTEETYKIPFIIDIMGDWKGLIKTIILSPRAILYYSQLVKTFKNEGIQVILMSGFTEKLLVTFLAAFYQIPVVWIEYGPLNTVFRRNFYLPMLTYRLLRNLPKSVIVPSENTKNSLIIDAHMSLAKIYLIPCGISIYQSKVKRGLAVLKRKFVIGSVSRLTRTKGQQYIIKAMPLILKNIPNAHLLIVGSGPDREYFESITRELNLEKHVTFMGFVPNVIPYYKYMEIFVFASIWDLEGFGLVVPEAMSYKIPIIGSAIGPVPEIIEDGKTGLLVPPKDSKAIAKAVLKLYKDPVLRKKLGVNGYIKTVKFYNIEVQAKKILGILRQALTI